MLGDYNLIKQIVRNVIITISYITVGIMKGIIIDLITIPLSAIITNFKTDN